jgi:ectoine hydroxylase
MISMGNPTTREEYPVSAEAAGGTFKLDSKHLALFQRDGFVVVPRFFSEPEISPLREACRIDPSIGGRLRAVADSTGNAQEVIEWTTFSDDYLGVVPRLARLIEGAEALLGKPVYHWHSKLSMKAPHALGRWDWHQDYPYWYDEGCLSPDMLTCMIAVDRTTRANGCVNLIAGSHKYGRIDHVRIGASSGCDPQRLELIKRNSPPLPVEMESGDACFFHCNTLHASAGNSTDSPRTLLHCTYNAIENSPFIEEGQEHHRYRPFEKLPDTALLDHRWKDVFKNHTFNSFGNVGTVNKYGYQVIARG